MLTKVVFNTAGTGLWSNVAKAVEVVDMRLHVHFAEKDFGELCVEFNTETWDVEVDGLIYTDEQFLSNLREFCNVQGLDGNDISYSEQGMQGDDYVSLDVGANFITSWEAKFGELVIAD